MKSGVKLGGIFDVWCYRPDGSLKWEDRVHNTVVNEGLNYLLNMLLKNNTWYIGLTSGTPTIAAADSLTGTHAGWTEVTVYSEGIRQEFIDGALDTQSVDNSASKAAFSINANGTTVGGAFLADSSTTGANGTLLCAAAFTNGDKSADSGDTLEVQYTYSAADDEA